MSFFWKAKDSVKRLFINNDLPKSSEAMSLDVLRAFSERYGLSDVLPYESYDEQTKIYYNNDTAGFMLYSMPSTGLVEDDLRVLNGLYNGIYPEDTLIQVSIISDSNVEHILESWVEHKLNCINKNNLPMFEFLAKNRAEMFNKGKWKSILSEQPYIVRNFHLIVSFSIPTKHFGINLPKEEVERLERTRKNFISSLSSAGIPSKSLEPDHFLNIMNGLLNPSKERHPYIEYNDENLIREQIMSSETLTQIAASGATITHKECEYSVLPYNVRQYPKHWAGYRNAELIGSFTDDVKRIGCPFIATFSVLVPDQTETKSRAIANSTRATQMSDSPIARYVPQWVERKFDWQFTVDGIENGHKLLESCYQVILFTPKGTEQEAEESILSLYSTLGWVLERSRYTVLHSLINALPMGASCEVIRAMRLFKYYRRMMSQNCTNVAPWVAEYKGSSSPLMLFTGKRGQINFFDPFTNNKGNYNVAVAAASGAGKSFLVQDFAYSILGGGGRAFIIDAGHSYRNLCNLLNGTYIDFGDSSANLCFNPFSNINESEALIEIDDDLMGAGKTSLVTHFQEQLPMLKQMVMQMAVGAGDEVIMRKQEAFIERAIVKAWKAKKSKACIDDVINNLREDMFAENKDDYTGRDLAIMLFPWSKDGMYSRYVNGVNSIDLENEFVVLDLDGLRNTKDLQSVSLLMLMMQITQTMYIKSDKAQRKICIIDEAWKIMNDGKNAAEIIEEGYRVARKHGGSFVSITQSIGDYYKSASAKAALVNADFEIYLRQKPSTLNQAIAEKYIDDSDGKVQLIRSLNTIQGEYSDIAIISPDGISVNRLIVDEKTQKIYSTSPDEVAFIKNAQTSGATLLEAVDALIKQQG